MSLLVQPQHPSCGADVTVHLPWLLYLWSTQICRALGLPQSGLGSLYPEEWLNANDPGMGCF